MFIISQYLLNLSGTCKNINHISTYSIITGLILYASIYLYLLFYNDEYLSIFNKFLIYIIVVDLLLSTFYYFNLQKSFKYDTNKNQVLEDNLESADMSINEDDISDTCDESEEELDESEEELDEEELDEELDEEELEEEDLQEVEREDLQEVEQEVLQEVKRENLQEVKQEDIVCEKDFSKFDLDEIDELLSIPVLEEIVPNKVKAKRQPRKKKDII